MAYKIKFWVVWSLILALAYGTVGAAIYVQVVPSEAMYPDIILYGTMSDINFNDNSITMYTPNKIIVPMGDDKLNELMSLPKDTKIYATITGDYGFSKEELITKYNNSFENPLGLKIIGWGIMAVLIIATSKLFITDLKNKWDRILC